MSDFDQLIKEKVNSKEYSYSAKNWQSFTQKAGWKGGFTLLHGLLTGASVIAVAVGVYVAVRMTGGEAQQSTPPTKGNSDTEIVVKQDSLIEEVPVMEEVVEMEAENTTTRSVNNDGARLPKNESTATEVSTTDTVKEEPHPVQKPMRRERITHIFEINTDTIPSNDF